MAPLTQISGMERQKVLTREPLRWQRMAFRLKLPAPQIVGVSSDGTRAVWEMNPLSGKFSAPVDPNTRLDEKSPWTITSVAGINNSGVIIGNGIKTLAPGSTESRGVMLVPVDLAVDANRDGTIRFAGNFQSTQVHQSTRPRRPNRSGFGAMMTMMERPRRGGSSGQRNQGLYRQVDDFPSRPGGL